MPAWPPRLLPLLIAAAAAATSASAGPGGWAAGADASLECECTVARAEASSLTPEAFESRYRRPGVPVVLTGLAAGGRNGAFRRGCEREALVSQFGGLDVVLASANTHSRAKRPERLSAHAASLDQPLGEGAMANETWYFFGDEDREAWEPLTSLYEPPPLVPPGSEVTTSFGLGRPGSGVPFHVHGAGFAETAHGRKRWLLAPPHLKPLFDPDATTLAWVRARQRGEVEPPEGLQECVLGPGEAVFFPDGWWHATLNLDAGAFISTFVNFPEPAPAAGGKKERDKRKISRAIRAARKRAAAAKGEL